MADNKIYVVATVVPVPSKKDIVQEALIELAKKVKENEPGVLKYKLYWDEDGQQFVWIEIYESQEALDSHRQTEWNQELKMRAVKEQLLMKPLGLQFIRPIGGYDQK